MYIHMYIYVYIYIYIYPVRVFKALCSALCSRLRRWCIAVGRDISRKRTLSLEHCALPCARAWGAGALPQAAIF